MKIKIKKIASIALAALLIMPLQTVIAANCNGEYNGKKLTRKQIEDLIATKQNLNLCGANLSGIDLSNLKLAAANFDFANLKEASFVDSDLTNASLIESSLNSANLQQTFFRWANLTAANLSNANLKGSDLSHANLENSNLERANLSNGNIKNANLNHSNLIVAQFDNADLYFSSMQNAQALSANFSNANLLGANLSGTNATSARFNNANLSRVDFSNVNATEANFTMANIRKADLSGTNFANANFLNATFQPKLGKLPNIVSLVSVKNFSSIKFYDESIGAPSLNELRMEYQKTGMRNMERLLTSMVKTRQMQQGFDGDILDKLAAGASYLLFYATSNYGLHPARPLIIFLALWLLYAILYRIIISCNNKRHGIYVKWNALIKGHIKTIEKPLYSCKCNGIAKTIKTQLKLGITSMYFSLLSSFQIGWEDFNLANWLQQLQFKEYEFIATGMVRFLSGSQALVSIYLFILWALTYFGHPFQW